MPSLLETLKKTRAQQGRAEAVQPNPVDIPAEIPVARPARRVPEPTPAAEPAPSLKDSLKNALKGAEDQGYVWKFDRGQRRFLRGTRGETRSGTQFLSQQPGGRDILAEEMERGKSGFWHTMGRLTDPVFDMLTIGEFSAPIAMKMLEGEGAYEAIKQAGREMGDKLPGLEIEGGQKHTSWVDVASEIQKRAGLDDITGTWVDKVPAFVAGFAADILTDPITYIPGGVLVTGGKRVSRAIGLSKALSAAGRTKAGALLGKGFIPHFELDAMVKRGDLAAEGAAAYKRTAQGERTLADLGEAELRDRVLAAAGDMTQNELRVMGLYLQDPSALVRELRSITKTPQDAEKLHENVAKFRDIFMEMFQREHPVGVIDERFFQQWYAAGLDPTTEASKDFISRMMKSRGIEEQASQVAQYLPGAQRVPGQDVAGFAKHATRTVQGATLAGVPRELNVALMAVRRGKRSLKEVSGRRLMDSTIDNPNLGVKLDTPGLIAKFATKESQDGLAKKGYGIFPVVREGNKVDVILPQPIIDDFQKLQKQFETPSAGAQMFDHYKELVNLWKGYAVLSPGFHMRNMYSNWMNNYIGGVNDPRTYAEAMVLQTGGVDSRLAKWIQSVKSADDVTVTLKKAATLPDGRILAKGTVLRGEEIRDVARIMDVESVGLFTKDMPTQMEREIHARLGRTKWGRKLPTREAPEVEKVSQEMFDSARQAKGSLEEASEELRAQRQALLNVISPERKAAQKAAADAPPSLADVLRHEFKGVNFHISGSAGEIEGLPNHYYAQHILSKNAGTSSDEVAEYLAKYRPELGITNESDLVAALKEGGDKLYKQVSDFDARVMKLEQEAAERAGATAGELGPRQLEDLEGELYAVNAQISDAKRGIDEATRPLQKGLTESIMAEQPAELQSFLRRTFGQEGTVLQANRWFGQQVENNARLAHFIHKLRKGHSVDEAAASVKKYLFDYGELTDFERDFLKPFIPFYSWMRKNTPLQIQAIVEDPGRYARIPKAMNAIEALSEEQEGITIPDYFQELHAVRLPWKEDDKPIYLNPNLPFQDLNRMNWRDIVGGLTPILRIPMETALGAEDRGFSIFLDRPIERYPGEEGRVLPVRRKYEAALEGLIPTLGKVNRMIDKVRRGDALYQGLTEGAGVKVMRVHPEREALREAREKRDAVRRARQRIKERDVDR
uniref:Uncharacterized protein n=1 Tax=viral metagenome TaxID=1070528 RepID=A0A6M3KM92_9ZZZZ